MDTPTWFKPLAVSVAVVLAALLLVGAIGVAYRSLLPPEGYDQQRLHWNTKNATRFSGADAGQVAALVSRAVYPATEPANTPSVVILHDPVDWRGGLAAASLLRSLNAVLLPNVPGIEAEIRRLGPTGSPDLEGAQLILINGATAPQLGLQSRSVSTGEVIRLLESIGAPPQHAILVDRNDPATAILAAPWLTVTGDAVVFDEADAPGRMPIYALGNIESNRATTIGGSSPVEAAVNFARYEDPNNPLFGWGFRGENPTGYRAYAIARPDDPATALQSASLAVRGKPGPLLWTEERQLPQWVNNYLWSQRPAFFNVPNEGPFHHFWILGDPVTVAFPAQGQADYAVEIGPYRLKGAGLSGMEMLAPAWVALGAASALWIAFHSARFLPQQFWVMRLAWPLLALILGPFGIPFYMLAYGRPVVRHDGMTMWDRPLWMQGLSATASAVGFGGPLMVVTGYLMTFFGLPLIPNDLPWVFWLGAPMVLVMIAAYIVAVLVTWPIFQTPMIGMFLGLPYVKALGRALPVVLASMASVSLAMFPAMWWLMMGDLPRMPDEEGIVWYGVMFFTVFLGFLIAWPFNYLFVRSYWKSGLM